MSQQSASISLRAARPPGSAFPHVALGAAAGATALGWGITSHQLRRERTDDLTGLPTRRRFMASVKRHLRWSRGDLRFVLIDLDRFKSVNDEFGHDVGDLVLWHTAQRLTRALPTLRGATRLGGDEFGALITQPTHEDIDILVRALSAPVRLPDVELPFISASFGDVVVAPRSGATASSALRAADQSMYRHKRACRNRFPRRPGASSPSTCVPPQPRTEVTR